MARKIRVLIVDDSTVIRRLLSDTLSEDRDIEIAGTAANGKIALAKLPQVSPDVITLDMEMPEMDGITTLVEVRKQYPNVPIIMFSTLTERGAHATFDALAKGATDYVTKPANVGSVSDAIQNVRTELIPKIKEFCGWYSAAKPRPATLAPAKPRAAVPITPTHRPKRIDVLAIGVSTGGPNALAAVLPKFPASFPVPIVIVQHMPPIFTKHLADRLDQSCEISVREAAQGDKLKAGEALVAPGGFHMVVRREQNSVLVDLNEDPPENSCRPAVDVLFRSVADLFGPNTLATVLTGMGRDGMLGCEVIRGVGGTIFAQDEETSVVWGMPGAVAEADLADRILPLDDIANEISFVASHGRQQRLLAGAR